MTIIVDEKSNVSITLPLYDIEIDVPDAYMKMVLDFMILFYY